MLDKLFSSRARVAILKLFLFNPQDSFYQRQISLRAKQPISGVQREVEKLEKIGLIEKSVQGNRIYYKINKRCRIYDGLKEIFFKSVGIAEVLKCNLINQEAIEIAFIYGSYATNQESLLSDIDLLAIGNITSKELSRVFSEPKRELGREINYTSFPVQEFKERLNNNDHFLKTILREKKIFIIGSENELKSIIKSR